MNSQVPDDKIIKETSLGLEEIENEDVCLCLDCVISKNGL